MKHGRELFPQVFWGKPLRKEPKDLSQKKCKWTKVTHKCALEAPKVTIRHIDDKSGHGKKGVFPKRHQGQEQWITTSNKRNNKPNQSLTNKNHERDCKQSWIRLLARQWQAWVNATSMRVHDCDSQAWGLWGNREAKNKMKGWKPKRVLIGQKVDLDDEIWVSVSKSEATRQTNQKKVDR